MSDIIAVDHIGIVVNNIDEAIEMYKVMFGFKYINTTTLEDKGIKIAIVYVSNLKIELIESISDQSRITKFLQKKGPGVHHIAFEVNDVVTYAKRLEEKGCTIVDNAYSAGIDHSRIAFIHPKKTGNVLYELCEK